MIRVAVVEDIPRLVELGSLLHGAALQGALPFDADKVAQFLAGLIAGGGVIFVAERAGVVIGGMAGGITEQWYSRARVAFDYSLFIEPGARHGITALRLLRAFMVWAELMGAAQVHLGISTGINVEATARLYESQGFVRSGHLFNRSV